VHLTGRSLGRAACIGTRRCAYDEVSALFLQIAQLDLNVVNPLPELGQTLAFRWQLSFQAARQPPKSCQLALPLAQFLLASAIGNPAVGQGSTFLREIARGRAGEFYAVHLFRHRVIQHRVSLKQPRVVRLDIGRISTTKLNSQYGISLTRYSP